MEFIKNKNEVIISVPRWLTMENSVKFACELRDLPESGSYLINFERAGRIEPFALVYLSSELQRFISKRKGGQVKFKNYEECTYAAHMGFFKSFGLDFGKYAGEARGSGTYIPITIYDTAEITKEAYENYETVGDFLHRKAKKMANILARSDSGNLFDTLTYSIREIIRNVIEHSKSLQFGFCAQYWATYDLVELAILDRGIGIRGGLSSNPHLNITNDHDALNLSLMPGISGKAFKGTKQDKNDVWSNSGYGLYMTSRLCREGGSFFIASGSTGLYLSEKKKRYLETPFEGTIIKLSLNTNRLHSLRERRNKYLDDAAKYDVSNNHSISMSKASMMITNDFE